MDLFRAEGLQLHRRAAELSAGLFQHSGGDVRRYHGIAEFMKCFRVLPRTGSNIQDPRSRRRVVVEQFQNSPPEVVDGPWGSEVAIVRWSDLREGV